MFLSAMLFAVVSLSSAFEDSKPSIPLVTLDGQPLAMNNFAERPLTVVVAMSARCSRSAEIIPVLNRLQGEGKYRLRNVLYVGLFSVAAETGAEIRTFCQARDAHFPVYRDADQRAARQLGLTATPEAAMLDPAGKLVFRTGLDDGSGVEALEAAMVSLLAGKSIDAQPSPTRGTPIGQPNARPLSVPTQPTPIFRSELIFSRIAGAPTHHCSTIAAFTDGELVCVWYGGSFESADDQTLFLARRPAGGSGWQAPEIVHRDAVRPPGNAVVFVDGRDRLRVLWGRMESSRPLRPGGGWGNCRLFLRTSHDRGKSWGADRPLEPDLLALPRNPPICRADGALLLPLSGNRGSFFVSTNDHGETWHRSAMFRGGSQPTIVERKDGSLLALLRHSDWIQRSVSADGGKTWSAAAATAVPNPGAGICAIKLRSGAVVLVCNNVAKARTPLSILVSDDDGDTWSRPLSLESIPGEFSYPCAIQSADGLIHVTYTYQRRNIKHVEFNEAWLAQFLPAVFRDHVAARPTTEDAATITNGLGGRSRAITVAHPLAQSYFDRGMGFLYAFNHDEAIRAFEKALTYDPSCPLAHWGIALAHGPHINNTAVPNERNAAALKAIVAAKACLDKATPVERALIAAVEKRYAEPSPDDRGELNRAYAAAMKDVWRQFPKDADVGSIFAESMMNLRPWDLWTASGSAQPGTAAILQALEDVLKLAPMHPLALHLYIHAVEASPQPEKADDVANRLRDLAPALGHLVHMPSHIDVRRGRWQQAIDANRRAIEADANYAAANPKQGFYRIYMSHNRHMLSFAATMQGQSKLALEAVRAMLSSVPPEWLKDKTNAAIVDGYLAMPAEILMRFGRWNEVLQEPEPDQRFPVARALRRFCRGSSRTALGDIAAARAEAKEFHAAVAATPKEAFYGNNAAADIFAVAAAVLEGEILLREGKTKEGLESLRQAVRLEDKLKYDEPPDWFQPVRHALGAALVATGQPAEAEVVYRDDLRKWPNNGWSLFGLAQGLRLQGKLDAAAEAEHAFRVHWSHADVVLKASCFCQAPKE